MIGEEAGPLHFLLHLRQGQHMRDQVIRESPAHLLLEDAHLLPAENRSSRGDLALFLRQGVPLGLVSFVPEDVRLNVRARAGTEERAKQA